MLTCVFSIGDFRQAFDIYSKLDQSESLRAFTKALMQSENALSLVLNNKQDNHLIRNLKSIF